MKIVILVIVLAILLLIVFVANRSKKTTTTANSDAVKMFDKYDSLFKNDVSYVDFVKFSDMRNPLLYFELRQLYEHRGDNVVVTHSNYGNILNKLKAKHF